MILDIFNDENTKVVVSYLPVWEFFFSMHVLSKPEHHISRQKWVLSNEQRYPEIVKKIRDLKEVTNLWIFIIDSEKWSEIRQMEIVEMLDYFRKRNIYQWNQWIEKSAGHEISLKERDEILKVMECYYKEVFKREELVLRPYLTRIIQNEKQKCEKTGLWKWIGKTHTRLCVDDTTIVYKKNKEYKYTKKEIKSVFITVSTFVYPHLWLFKNKDELEIVKSVVVEKIENDIPEDFVRTFKALGDKTRLQIIKRLMHDVCTTQALAKELEISEAAISKHLKVLVHADLVQKNKKGLFMEYKLKEEEINFIPYRFYELMMQ